MQKECLHQLIKKYGEKVLFKKGEHLFLKGKKDYNLYYIEKGNVVLMDKGTRLFYLGEGEIVGEKSFVEHQDKPIDAMVDEKTVIYRLSPLDFEKVVDKNKNSFYECLVSTLSQRVYNLNSVLGLLFSLNEAVLDYIINKNNKVLSDYISNFMDLEGYSILKYEKGGFMQIDGNIVFQKDLETFLDEIMKEKVSMKIGKNYLFINSRDFIYLLQGKVNVEKYVLINTIMYGLVIFNYLGELLEKQKNTLALDVSEMLNE